MRMLLVEGHILYVQEMHGSMLGCSGVCKRCNAMGSFDSLGREHQRIKRSVVVKTTKREEKDACSL